MRDLAGEVAAGLPHHSIAPRLEAIRADDASTLSTSRDVAVDGPTLLRRVLRAVASGQQLADAADVLEQHDHPALAELLRVYGTGSAQEAGRHYAGLTSLVPSSRSAPDG